MGPDDNMVHRAAVQLDIRPGNVIRVGRWLTSPHLCLHALNGR